MSTPYQDLPDVSWPSTASEPTLKKINTIMGNDINHAHNEIKLLSVIQSLTTKFDKQIDERQDTINSGFPAQPIMKLLKEIANKISPKKKNGLAVLLSALKSNGTATEVLASLRISCDNSKENSFEMDGTHPLSRLEARLDAADHMKSSQTVEQRKSVFAEQIKKTKSPKSHQKITPMPKSILETPTTQSSIFKKSRFSNAKARFNRNLSMTMQEYGSLPSAGQKLLAVLFCVRESLREIFPNKPSVSNGINPSWIPQQYEDKNFDMSAPSLKATTPAAPTFHL